MHSSKKYIHVQVDLIYGLHFLCFLIAMNEMMMMGIIIIIIAIIMMGNVNVIIFVISENDKKIRLFDSTINTVTNL